MHTWSSSWFWSWNALEQNLQHLLFSSSQPLSPVLNRQGRLDPPHPPTRGQKKYPRLENKIFDHLVRLCGFIGLRNSCFRSNCLVDHDHSGVYDHRSFGRPVFFFSHLINNIGLIWWWKASFGMYFFFLVNVFSYLQATTILSGRKSRSDRRINWFTTLGELINLQPDRLYNQKGIIKKTDRKMHKQWKEVVTFTLSLSSLSLR